MAELMHRLDLVNYQGNPFRVILVPANVTCPNHVTLTDTRPLVEFYDRRFSHTPDGQFVSRYFLTTLLENDSGYGLCLDGGVPAWSLGPGDMRLVRSWLSHNTKG